MIAYASPFCSRCGIYATETYGADPPHSGTGLIYEMVLVKKLKLEASGHECRKQYS